MKKRILFFAVVLFALMLSGCKSSDYKEAMQLYVRGDYEAACGIFSDLGDYEDSPEMVKKSTYALAIQWMDDELYMEAAELFQSLGGYEKSDEKAAECLYNHALMLLEENRNEEARDIFAQLGDYRDAAEYAQGMMWQVFTRYIADQGKVIAGDSYTVTLSMSGDKIYAELTDDFEIGFSGSMLIDQEDPVAELRGTITIGYGEYPVDVSGVAAWDLAGYQSGDEAKWEDVEFEDLSDLPSSARSVLHQLTAEYFLGSGDAAEIMKRMTDGIQQALTESALGVTMADLGFTSY